MNRRNFLKEGTKFAATALTTGSILHAVTASASGERAGSVETTTAAERPALLALNGADQEVLAFLRTHSSEISFMTKSTERTEIRARITDLSTLSTGLQSHKGQFGKIIARKNTIQFTYHNCAYLIEHQIA